MVGDRGGRFERSNDTSSLVFLDEADQIAMNDEFVASVPWKHFGRKNIGYLYAIRQGAERIFDIDDDNEIALHYKSNLVEDGKEWDTIAPSDFAQSFNVYPMMGAREGGREAPANNREFSYVRF